MGGRVMMRGCGPKHLKAGQRWGWAQSDASGFLRYHDEMVDDRRQGRVHRTEADYTPGFGTNHPQDLKNLGTLDDPTPIPNARPADDVNATSAERGISDQEIQAAVREGRQPREGY